MSLDLVTYMYETVWFHFHAIVKSLLIDENTDMRVQFSALVIPYHTIPHYIKATIVHTYIQDILCYSLTSSIFLNMKIESSTLANLLRQYSEICWKNKTSLYEPLSLCVCVCVYVCVCVFVCMYVCNI